MQEKIPHWLTKRAYLSPEAPAIELDTGEVITFIELKNKAEQLARQLANLGIGKNDKVGLFFGNEREMIIAIHSISYLGSVAVLLNTRLTKSEITYQVEDAEVKLVLTSDSLYDHVLEMNLPSIVKRFSEIREEEEKDVPLVCEISLQDPYTIVYTSGTTGNPKGVVHTYGNHWWSAIGSVLNLGLTEQDKWLAVLPLFHVSGFSICMRSVLYGIPIFLMEKFDAEAVNEAIISKGVTIISVVTVMLQRLYDELGEKSYPKSFRCMLIGGGPVPRPLLEKAAAKNIPVFQSYGLTETSSQIVTLSPTEALKKLGSAGKPLFPGQLHIHNPDEQGVGEIFVKGPMVTKGYFKNPEANNKSFTNGWLATGDLGYVDEDGFLYVVDRRTDLIISGGENIYPSEIESVLSGYQGVKEVGVVGKKDPTWGEVPVAFIVKDERIEKDELIQFAKEHLASYKVPKEIYFLDHLPRTASNKLMRNVLKEQINKE